MITFPPDAIRYEGDRPVAAGELELASPVRTVRTGSGNWALYAAGEQAVLVHPAGGVQGRPGEVAGWLRELSGDEGRDAADREAAATLLPFLAGEGPGGPQGPGGPLPGPRSRVEEGVPPSYWISDPRNEPS
jgi:hypothetical protein